MVYCVALPLPEDEQDDDQIDDQIDDEYGDNSWFFI